MTVQVRNMVHNLDKACVLLALEEMYAGTADLSFLIDYFNEECKEGFPYEHFYLIEETIPLRIIGMGKATNFSTSYKQSERYVILIDWLAKVRYRIPATTKICVCYSTGVATSHAVCIPAHEINYYGQAQSLMGNVEGVMFDRKGILVDTNLTMYT